MLVGALIMALQLASHDRLVVTGITGAGKTHYVTHEVVKAASRVVVWDPKGEYELEHATLDEVAAAPELLDAERLRLAVVPTSEDLDELSEDFCDFVGLVKHSGGGFVLVVDEVVLLEGRARRMLAYIATQSRAWGDGVPLVLVSQRATDIPKTARVQASRIVTFRQTDPDDVAALREVIGARAEQIPKLPRHECVTWHESESFEQSNPKEKQPC